MDNFDDVYSTANFDGQGKSLEDETIGSMRVAAVALLASTAVFVGGIAAIVAVLA